MAYTNQEKLGIGFGATGLGAGLAGLFGGNKNPASAGMGYLDQIPGSISPYYQPYIEAGKQAIPKLQGQYDELLNNPGQKLNQMGGSFQYSPGYQFALQQALGGAGHAAAAGGYAGTPMHEQQNMQIASQLGNQDYYNWLGHAQQLYGAGLSGEQGFATQGLNASTSMSDQIAQALAAQSNLAYEGQAAKNAGTSSGWGNLIGGAATLAAFL